VDIKVLQGEHYTASDSKMWIILSSETLSLFLNGHQDSPGGAKEGFQSWMRFLFGSESFETMLAFPFSRWALRPSKASVRRLWKQDAFLDSGVLHRCSLSFFLVGIKVVP
jgi:hypothetical protein